MILIDTSVWVRHLRSENERLMRALEDSMAATHDFVIGELALGALHPRAELIGFLSDMPRLARADDREVLGLIETRHLSGTGIGYVDAHLVASLMLSPGVSLWSADRRLAMAAQRCGVAVFSP